MPPTSRKAAHAAYDVVGYLRPDLLYLDDLDVDRLFALHERAVLTPSWQTWHGMNDRFAFALRSWPHASATASAAAVDVADRPMHSETFARFAMVGVHNASLELTHMLVAHARTARLPRTIASRDGAAAREEGGVGLSARNATTRL